MKLFPLAVLALLMLPCWVVAQTDADTSPSPLLSRLRQGVSDPVGRLRVELLKAGTAGPQDQTVQTADSVCDTAYSLTVEARTVWCSAGSEGTFWVYTYAMHLLLAADTTDMAARALPSLAGPNCSTS